MASFNDIPTTKEVKQPVEKNNLFYREFTLLAAQEIIAEGLKRRNVTYTQMDEFLEKPPGYTESLLDDGRDLTFDTLSDCLFVLGYEVRINAKLISQRG